jgi:defect in organelle trafficking protein DotC
MDAVPLEQLQNPASAYYQEIKHQFGGGTGNLRLDAVREAAMGVGVRGGMAARTEELNKALGETGRQLDSAYDFRPYVYQGRVLPPVIVESRDVYTQGGDTALRLAGRTYKIEAQARFVSRTPMWRDYLITKYEVSMPSPALLPRSPEEAEAWRGAVAEGWKQGSAQADLVFKANFDRLDRDFLGVLRFHTLAASNMVTLPVVASTTVAVTASKGQMAVDERLLRITVLPEFSGVPARWVPAPGMIHEVDALGDTPAREAMSGRGADKTGTTVAPTTHK